MKLLITGAAGFLGLHTAQYFKKKGFDLTLLDIQLFEKKEYPPGSTFIQGDIRDAKLMNKISKNVDFVIHAAAALPLWKKEEIYNINIQGTQTVLQASLDNKVKRVLYVSSTAVYGIPKKHPIMEEDDLVGVGAYGESKIKAEELCRQFRSNKMNVIILRPKTFVGTHRLGVFEILFDWIKDGKKIPVIGNGNNKYQLLDVDDLVEAMYRLLVYPKSKEISTEFNIGAPQFNTVRKDLEKLFAYAHSGSKLLTTPAWPIKKALFIFEKLGLSPLYQWVYDTADKDSFVSIDRLTKTLGWKLKYSNSEALIKSYQWYLDNYKEIKSRKVGVTHTVGWKQGILGFFKRFL